MTSSTSSPSVRNLPALTSPELDVMKTLWSRGSLGAREVQDLVGREKGWAYSTTRTTLERMVGKGLVRKEAFHGLYLYAPAISRAMGLAKRVRDFARHVLESDPAPVVSLFAEAETLGEEEIAELERLLKESGP